MKHVDADGFTCKGDFQELDFSFLTEKQTGRIDNAFADNAFSISPDIKDALRNRDVETFENLCDGVM